jgi:hypothetical protein
METGKGQTVTIRVFGFLQRYMDEQGLSYTLEKDIPEEGCTAHELARNLSIPPEKIEAVFCNGGVINIYDTIFPGDRVGFFPHGIPGPYRVFLGIARENRERTRRETVDRVEKRSDIS